MKKIVLIILAIVLVVPPMQAHIDVVVFDHHDVEAHTDGLNDEHQQHHHEHDSDDEKNKEHHHHCSEISFANAMLFSQFSYEFIQLPEVRTFIISYESLYNSSYLDNLFQPPRA